MDYKRKQIPIYTVQGIVIHGRGIGKLVGMPTANLKTEKSDMLLEPGVYVTKVELENRAYYGVTHIGTRPTIDNDQNISVETHILNFNRDIYGCSMRICLYKKMRSPKKFDNLTLLLEQIRLDCLEVQDYWGIESVGSNLSVNLKNHLVKIGHQEIQLSNKEFDILYMLYSNSNVTFNKEEIYEAIWHEPANGYCHAVENTIFQIRKKLRPYANGVSYIKTIAGYGYRFNSGCS